MRSFTAGVPHDQDRVPVYVWDLVVRSCHWLVAGCIVVLSATGFYIGHPFITSPGPATLAFVMGWIKVVHFYAAMIFSLAVVARFVWMFLGARSSPWVHWTQYIPITRERRENTFGTLKFYAFLRDRPPDNIGHNGLAGVSYIAVFGLCVISMLTGLGLYGASAHVGSAMSKFGWLLSLTGGPQNARWIHHVIMWLLLGFAVHHVYSAWLTTKVEKNGTMDSIFTGWKLIRRQRRPHD